MSQALGGGKKGSLISPEFDGLTPEQIKEKIVQKFSESYGRYENISGTMWVEVYHNDKSVDGSDKVIWRKGTGDEITEDKCISHPEAIIKFMILVNKGYIEVFKGVTQADMDKGNALRLEQRSAPQREGWLGTYYKGDHFFRINQFKADDYYIESGYDGCTTNAFNENESGARYELDMALAKGFRREGEEVEDFVNPLEAFGLELDTIEAQEERERKSKETADGDLPDDFFELMK